MTEYKKLQLDLNKAKPGKVREVYIPRINYLVISGTAPPASKEYSEAIDDLYSLAYTIRFLPKNGYDIPGYEVGYPVGNLQANYGALEKGWDWQMMLPVPNFVTQDVIDRAKTELKSKGKPATSVELQSIEFGTCVQTLHVGPYDQESPAVELLNVFIDGGDRVARGHIEVYLNDPGRVPPDKIKTIIRFPYDEN